MTGPGRALAIANRHPLLRVDRRGLVRAVAALDRRAGDFRGGCPAGELSLVFLTEAALAQLHADFMGDPTPTDVITFPGDASLGAAGEICISADAARREARGRGKAGLSDELALYVIHGWLHLAGYDDRAPADRRAMRGAEARARRIWRAEGLGPTFALRAFSVRPLRART
jgi:probable rRNA maturation factor